MDGWMDGWMDACLYCDIGFTYLIVKILTDFFWRATSLKIFTAGVGKGGASPPYGLENFSNLLFNFPRNGAI